MPIVTEEIVNLIDKELHRSLAAADCVVRSKQCVSAEINPNEMVLMSVESGCYGGLDHIGSDIWRRLETPVTVAELCERLATEYDASLSDIETDVLVFLHGLRQKQMIDIVRESTR